MKATCSFASGICIIDAPGADHPIAVSADTAEPLASDVQLASLAHITDWRPMDAPNIEDVITATRSSHYLEQSRILVQLCMDVEERDVWTDLLQNIEHSLATHVQPQQLISRLLVAPLKAVGPMEALLSHALASGYAASASVLQQVHELQPLLRRLVEHWLAIPQRAFFEASRSRQQMWLDLVTHGKMAILLQGDRNTLVTIFGHMAFEESTPGGRTAVVRIGNELADRLQKGSAELTPLKEVARRENELRGRPDSVRSTYVLHQQAMAQIKAIANEVSRGNDERARRFLRELVDEQTASVDNYEYAVKSLCNIAKQCADMFRTDFERECLDAALDLHQEDVWMMVQLGDHLKRTGEYSEAIRVLRNAIRKDDPVVAISTLADVYAQQGDYERAIGTYKSIEGWHDIAEVRMAIADNLRRRGDFDAAETEYDKMEMEGVGSFRSLAGKAEIAKRRADFWNAEQMYRALMSRTDLDSQAKTVYRLALAGILKQAGRLSEAFELTQSVIEESPFAMQARLLRASILGLQNEEEKGLNSIVGSGGPRAYGEWVTQYYQGLLLLRLNKHSEAKEKLLSNLETALVTGDEHALLRLSAAFAFLAEGDVHRAEAHLESVVRVSDRYIQYLADVLRLHLAVANQDDKSIKKLTQILREEQINDPDLELAVVEIQRGNLFKARLLELDALLRVAA